MFIIEDVQRAVAMLLSFWTNSTLSSCPDEYGHRYWCSFCGKPCAKGRRLNAYRGILNGQGPQFGQHQIVKIFRNKRGSQRLCDIELSKTKKARQLSRCFEREFVFDNVITFVSLLKAHMDETPLLLCSSDWKRPLLKDEWVMIEERTGKRFKTFVDEAGVFSSCVRDKYILEAFIHYTYHQSLGSLVICGLEGTFEGGCYRFKSPTIHSVSEDFGDGDDGVRGINNVFDNHTCNGICESFIKPIRGRLSFARYLKEPCISNDMLDLRYLVFDNRMMPSAPPVYQDVV